MTGVKKASTFIAGACLIFCTAASAGGQASAHFVIPFDALNNGVAEMNSTNFQLAGSIGDAVAGGTIGSVSFQLRNGFRGQLAVSQAVLNLLTVVSRKMHGATPFELIIAHTQPLTGSITVEPRAIGSGHTLVFHFDGPVNSLGATTALDAALNTAGSTSSVKSGNDVIVTLTNVDDNKRLTITLNGINGSGNAAASIGFLVGDVNSSRSVNAADVSAIKARQGKPVNSDASAVFDVNADGLINAADLNAARARSGKVIP